MYKVIFILMLLATSFSCEKATGVAPNSEGPDRNTIATATHSDTRSNPDHDCTEAILATLTQTVTQTAPHLAEMTDYYDSQPQEWKDEEDGMNFKAKLDFISNAWDQWEQDMNIIEGDRYPED